jgi:hypothetical protein
MYRLISSARLTDEAVRRAATDLGWDLDFTIAARSQIIKGLLEASPNQVLKASILVTRLTLMNRSDSVRLADMIVSINGYGNQIIESKPNPNESKEANFSPSPQFSARYLRDVLGAPLRTGGTMAAVGAKLDSLGVQRAWGKSGTADAGAGGAGSPTRAVWQIGGFTHNQENYTFLLIVASPSPSKPLGQVQSDDISLLTNALIGSVFTE